MLPRAKVEFQASFNLSENPKLNRLKTWNTISYPLWPTNDRAYTHAYKETVILKQIGISTRARIQLTLYHPVCKILLVDSCGICGNFSGSFVFTWTLPRTLNRERAKGKNREENLHQNSSVEFTIKAFSYFYRIRDRSHHEFSRFDLYFCPDRCWLGGIIITPGIPQAITSQYLCYTGSLSDNFLVIYKWAIEKSCLLSFTCFLCF